MTLKARVIEIAKRWLANDCVSTAELTLLMSWVLEQGQDDPQAQALVNEVEEYERANQ